MDTVYDPLNKSFDDYIEQLREEFHTPGIAIAVVKGDKTWSRGYGYADLETKDPVTPHTLFYTASTTKSFTAAVTSKLVYNEDKSKYGDIKWTTPLADLIRDDFVLQDEYATKHITFADALSHRTGMPRHDLTWINGNPSSRERTRHMRYLPLHNEIRTNWEYCNLMYSAVTYAAESVTGKSMKELLKSWIWDPLGMNETTFSIADALAIAEKHDGVNTALPYLWDEKTKSNVKLDWKAQTPASGSGGMISNVLDYTKWIRLFLHPDSDIHNPNSTLTPKAVDAMTQAHMPVPINPDIPSPYTGPLLYGLGLYSGIYRGYQVNFHEGGIPGYMSVMWWIPKLEWGLVVFHNSYNLEGRYIMWRLIDDFLGTPDEERFDGRIGVEIFKKKATEKWEDPRKHLFPDTPVKAELKPALKLEDYAGAYYHPAFNTFTVLKPDQHASESAHDVGSHLQLQVAPSKDSFFDMKLVFEHVNGENWIARLTQGPAPWLCRILMKAKFDVGVDGKVKRLGLQMETAMDELIWFDKQDKDA